MTTEIAIFDPSDCSIYIDIPFPSDLSSYSTCWIKRKRDMDVIQVETAVAAVLDMKVCPPL
jgi:hypothetical protein